MTDSIRLALGEQSLLYQERTLRRRNNRRNAQEFSVLSKSFDATRGEVTVTIPGGGSLPTQTITNTVDIKVAAFPRGGLRGSSDAKPV